MVAKLTLEINPHSVKLFLMKSVSYVLSLMMGEGRGSPKPSSKYTHIFYSFLSPKRQRINLVKINGAELVIMLPSK